MIKLNNYLSLTQVATLYFFYKKFAILGKMIK